MSHRSTILYYNLYHACVHSIAPVSQSRYSSVDTRPRRWAEELRNRVSIHSRVKKFFSLARLFAVLNRGPVAKPIARRYTD
jgi:hypothetical protein